MKINKLSLPTTIIIASLILGGFYYASQVNKQQSIERQQEIKRKQECYDRDGYYYNYYYNEKNDLCEKKERGRKSLDEIFGD